jgi:hypothetical protein
MFSTPAESVYTDRLAFEMFAQLMEFDKPPNLRKRNKNVFIRRWKTCNFAWTFLNNFLDWLMGILFFLSKIKSIWRRYSIDRGFYEKKKKTKQSLVEI